MLKQQQQKKEMTFAINVPDIRCGIDDVDGTHSSHTSKLIYRLVVCELLKVFVFKDHRDISLVAKGGRF